MKKKVFIVGLGLIGGSLGLALRESPHVESITGFDQDEAACDMAAAIGAVDKKAGLREGAKDADVIIICTPLGVYNSVIEQIAPVLKPGALLTDVGSTKVQVMELFASLPSGIHAIGGHPMAGAETQGIAGADRYLFENAVYVLTAEPDTPQEMVRILESILASTGARIKHMEAVRHDELVATVSHIPHLAAVALVELTQGRQEELMLAAGGFRDTTRIASSNPDLWQDIAFSNREPIIRQLNVLGERLDELKKALENGDREDFKGQLEKAKSIRDSIPKLRKGLIPFCHDLVCIVPDRPGVIGQLGIILDQENINIVDIEILRAREGDGGTIRLGVASSEQAEEAVQALQARGIKAWLR
ncbi:MAG: prephenate dehydrogenase [Syntrophomonas sp.]